MRAHYNLIWREIPNKKIYHRVARGSASYSRTTSKVFLEKVLVEPADFVESSPKLAGLVDVNLASLLCVGLAELFGNTQRIEASFKDTTLAAQISCAA